MDQEEGRRLVRRKELVFGLKGFHFQEVMEERPQQREPPTPEPRSRRPQVNRNYRRDE